MVDRHVRQFLRAATQRLAAARVLHNAGLYRDAVYLGGYAPECSLKAMLLSRVPSGDRESYIRDRFRGRIAHDFDHLAARIRGLGVNVPKPIIEAMRELEPWSIDMRYDPGLGDEGESADFLKAAETILRWAERGA